MRNHCKRLRQIADCRYTFQQTRGWEDCFDGCDDYYYGREDCTCSPQCSFAHWFGISYGNQNLNCSNGFRVRFNSSVVEPESGDYFRLSRDGRAVNVCESGIYEIRYSVLVPSRIAGNIEFFVAQNNMPISSTRTIVSGNCCGRLYGSEASVRIRGGSRLSLMSSDEYCAKAPQPCTTMASMSISGLR